MSKYKFYSKGSNEAIGTVDANSLKNAEKFFASLKQMLLKDFLEIYEVKLA